MESTLLVVGGGPAGLLTAYTLAKRINDETGKPRYQNIIIVERGPDLRTVKASELENRGNYSLVLSHRGLKALKKVGLREELCKQGTLYHRLQNCLGHDNLSKGMLSSAPYEKLAMRRFDVTHTLLIALTRDFGDRVSFHFNYSLVEVDFSSKVAYCVPSSAQNTAFSDLLSQTLEVQKISFDFLVGADGAHSRVIQSLRRQVHGIAFSQSFGDEPFVSVNVPFQEFEEIGLEVDKATMYTVQSPKRNASLVIIPNPTGLNISVVCSCYLPKAKLRPPGTSPENHCLHTISHEIELKAYLTTSFPRLGITLFKYLQPIIFPGGEKRLPSLFYTTSEVSQYHHPRCAVVALGDAVHSMPPYIGQGINAAFEDVEILDSLLETHQDDWEKVPALFSEARHPQGTAAVLLNQKYLRKNFTLEFALRLTFDIIRNLLSRRFSFVEQSVLSLLSNTSVPYTDILERRRNHFIKGFVCLATTMSAFGGLALMAFLKLRK